MARLLKDRKIAIDLSDAAKRWLGRVGYDPVYGARPLKRVIQKADPTAPHEVLLVIDGNTGRVDLTAANDVNINRAVLNTRTGRSLNASAGRDL